MTTTTNTILDDQSPSQTVKDETPSGECNQNSDKKCLVNSSNPARPEKLDSESLSNEDIVDLMISHNISVRKLENYLGKKNAERCVLIRRLYYTKLALEQADRETQELQIKDERNHENSESISRHLKEDPSILEGLPDKQFDYEKVVGACCENVVGTVRIPVGLAGPLLLDGHPIKVPMATTEGCLVASASRGLSALSKCGGVISRVTKNRMTRAPIVRFQDPQLTEAILNVDRAINWLKNPENKNKMQRAFRANSKHTELIDYSLERLGREIHIRFEAQTGDAMGMNMCSKGAENALKEMQRVFPTMQILTLSGNMCTDKKPSSINMIRGRGKTVICSASLKPEVVKEVLKVDIDSLINVWLSKVMIGSALAGSIGGNNCQAANIVSAIFIATGQDTAQVVSSSNCIIHLEKDSRGYLEVHCLMKSIECGTVGGGTQLADQAGYLGLMGINGSSPVDIAADGEGNACVLARIICATVMAAELSLLASLTEGTLVKAHTTHNKSAQACNLV